MMRNRRRGRSRRSRYILPGAETGAGAAGTFCSEPDLGAGAGIVFRRWSRSRNRPKIVRLPIPGVGARAGAAGTLHVAGAGAAPNLYGSAAHPWF